MVGVTNSTSNDHIRRSFLSTVLCCGSSTDTIPQHVQMATIPPAHNNKKPPAATNHSAAHHPSSKRAMLSVQQG